MVGTFLKAGGNAAGQKLSTITDLPDCESDTNKGSMSWCSESSWPFYYTDSACWQTSACWCPPTSACWPTPVYQQSQHRPSPCYAVTGVHYTGYRGSRAAYLDGDWFECQPDWPTSHCLPSRGNGAVWPRSGFDFSLQLTKLFQRSKPTERQWKRHKHMPDLDTATSEADNLPFARPKLQPVGKISVNMQGAQWCSG